MSDSVWQTEATRSLVVSWEVLVGILVILQAQFLADPVRAFLRNRYPSHFDLVRMYFWNRPPVVVDPRLIEVLERRRTAESLGAMPWYVFGGAEIVVAIATALHVIPAIASYLLMYVAAAATAGITLLRMRNRGDRRAAVLTPRDAVNRVVPVWLFVTSFFGALAPLTLIATPGDGIGASMAAAVGLALIVIAWILKNGMATILTGENPAVEIAVEQITRCRRVSRVLMLSVASATYFLMISAHSEHKPRSLIPAVIVSVLSLLVVALWDWYARTRTHRLIEEALHG